MKLYFYILERHYKQKPSFRFEECEVIEKPKTYCPVNMFPMGLYRSRINKSDIGRVLGYGNNLVILKEPNARKAKEIFAKMYESNIKQREEFLERSKAELNAILEMEEYLSE